MVRLVLGPPSQVFSVTVRSGTHRQAVHVSPLVSLRTTGSQNAGSLPIESRALAGAAKLVRSSHERFDGAGYPDGLSGEQIPLGARIIFVHSRGAADDAQLAVA